MFSWSKKKETRRRARPEKDSEENEFGIKLDKGADDKALAELKRLAGVDSFPEDDLNLNEEEDDVETELLRLMGGGKRKKAQKQPSNPEEPLEDISNMTADIDFGDEDVEVDENDTELLGELLDLINTDDEEVADEAESDPESEGKISSGESEIVVTIKDRLKLYKTAEVKAKESNESSRARRFARGIKTLEDLLKKAKAGKEVSPDDIPPVIAINLKPAPPPAPPQSEPSLDFSEENPTLTDTTNNEPSENKGGESGDVLSILLERLKLYQVAETKAKESGETTRARRFNRGIKTLQSLIKEAQAGKPVAAEDIPPEVALNLKPPLPVQEQPAFEENESDNHEERDENEMRSISLTGTPDDAESKESQDQERNIMDVLSERLTMYKTAEAKAKESGETSRVRRFARGIKTLQDLIRQATAGKPIAPDGIPPVIALNLKPVPVVAVSEEKSREAATERSEMVRSSDAREKPLAFAPVDDEDVDLDSDEEPEEETPRTVLEGLEQRVRLYSQFREEARKEGNASLADQNERIVKVYLNAIKTFRSGGYVDVEKLPNPRRCPAIPIPFYIP